MASKVRHFRKRLGMTQLELARLTGLSERAIRLLETGERKPRLTTARALADALGVSVEELFPAEGGGTV